MLLNLVQIIFVFRDPNFLDGTYVYTVNMYVQIIGVLLATVWCTSTTWYDDGPPAPPMSSVLFTSNRTQLGTGQTETGATTSSDEEQLPAGFPSAYHAKAETEKSAGA